MDGNVNFMPLQRVVLELNYKLSTGFSYKRNVNLDTVAST